MSITLADNARRAKPVSDEPPPAATMWNGSGCAQLRALAQRLGLGNQQATGCRTIGIASCSAGAGATMVATGLAGIATGLLAGEVLLVDTNWEKPELTRRCKARLSPGLCDLGSENADLDTSLQSLSTSKLKFLSPGRKACGEFPVQDVVGDWKARFDLVVVDLPTVKGWQPLLSLISALDGVVLVIEAETTNRDTIRRAKLSIQQSGVPILGALLNKQRQHGPEWLSRLF